MEKILIKDLIAKASEKLKKAEVTDYVIDSRLLAEYVFSYRLLQTFWYILTWKQM